MTIQCLKKLIWIMKMNKNVWARSAAHENEFVAVIMRFDTEEEYKCRKKEFVRRNTESRKCGCPFKLRGKPVIEGQGWMVKLICEIHNHELAKSLVRHPYVGQLTKDEKTIIVDMTKSMVKPRNILLTLKEHNVNSCTTIKQIYNARNAYHSSIRGSDTEMQHLMTLLEHDQYIHWHRLKDEFVVRDLFWCHPDAVKLCNACHLVFLIDSTYKTNRYKLLLLDIVGVTTTRMTFSVGHDHLPVVIVTNKDLALMNAVKTVFPECSNLLCRFHINKNVKAKCKSSIGQKHAWEYVMDAWGSLIDCPSEQQFAECLQKIEYAHWALKKVLHNSLGDLCSVWDAMNNMITLQHTQIKASFGTSTHVVGHVFKKTLYKRLLGMVSRYALNEIAAKFERVHYADKNPSSCGCVMRIPHVFHIKDYVRPKSPSTKRWRSYLKDLRNLMFMVNTNGAPKKPMNKNQRSTKRDPSYWEYVDDFHSVKNSNSSMKRSASSSDPPKPTRIIPMLDQFEPFIQDFIDNIVDVKVDGNCGYRSIAALLELDKWLDDYINLFGGTKRFEELRMSLLVDGFSKVSVDKWMDIMKMEYVIASRYNVILVSLSQQQSITFLPLRSQPPPDSFVHRIICVDYVFENHFVQLIMFVHVNVQHVYLKDCCPLLPLALLWSRNSHPQPKQWPTSYIS
ncbi:Protein FAR1-RELATED SEQUENCE 5 [Glycine soja]